MDIEPTYDNVLVKILTTLEKTKSNIVIPGMDRDERSTLEGEVVAIGPAVNNFWVGDQILCPSHWSHQMYRGGVEYAMVQQEKIRAKVKA